MASEPPPEVQPTPPEPPPGPIALTAEDRQWAMFAHLSALVASLVGGMSFLGPLIVWLIKKDQSKFVDFHGKEALNFQINMLVIILISIPLICVIVGIVTISIAGVIALVVPIVAGIKANNGEWWRIPYIFRLVK